MDSAADSHWRRRALLALAAVCSLTLVAAAPAAGDTSGPTPLQKRIALTSPGVVFITADVFGRVSDDHISGSGQAKADWPVTGSGFVVNGDGTVVTASHVIDPDFARYKYYLANKLFGWLDAMQKNGLDPYGPIPAGALSSSYLASEEYQLLLNCYKGLDCKFEFPRSAETIDVYTGVDLAGVQLGKPSRARVLLSTQFSNTDVAVLQIDEHGLPTVKLAQSAGDLAQGTQLDAIGFPGTTHQLPTGLTQPSLAPGQVSAVRSGGGTSGQEIEVASSDIEHGMSGGPVIDSNGVVGLVSFQLVSDTGDPGKNYLRTVDDIRSALAQVGKHPAAGPVDVDFAAGMERYWTQHYTTAVKELNRVIAEDPGHPAATKYLRLATAKAGTSADKDKGGGFKWWWIVVIAAAVAAIGGLAFWLLRRRGKAAAPAAAPAPSAPPAPPVPMPAPPAQIVEPAIVVRDGSKAGERYPITNELSLGREKSDLVIDDAEVSRSHAVLRAVDGGLEIKDVGSANGTFVNGTRIEANGARRLNDGDLITVGQTTLQVESPKPVNATVVHQTLVAPKQDQ
jgi:hypothetical protein